MILGYPFISFTIITFKFFQIRTLPPKQLDYFLLEFLGHSLPNTDNRVGTVKLRMGSESNCSYVTKALVRTITKSITKDAVAWNF